MIHSSVSVFFDSKTIQIISSDYQHFPSPKIQSSRCINQSTKDAFREISAFFDTMLEEGEISSFEKKKIEGGFCLITNIPEEKAMRLGSKMALVMNRAFPNLLSYIKFEPYLTPQELQDKLDSDLTTDQLILEISDIACERIGKKIEFPNEELELKEILALKDDKEQFERLENYFSKVNIIYQETSAAFAKIPVTSADVDHLSPSETNEFFRRASQNEKDSVFSICNHLSCLDEYLQAFQKGQWSHPIFSLQDWILQAIQEYRNGNLDIERISLLLLYDECQSVTNSEKDITFQLFDKKYHCNQESLDILKRATQGYFSDEEIERFIEGMKAFPAEKTQFFKVPLPEFCNSKMDIEENMKSILTTGIGNRPNILEYFYHLMKHRLFLIPSAEGQMEQVIFSPFLFYQLLIAKCGARAMKPNPVLGLSKVEDFENAEQRDVLLPCRFFSSPNEADLFPAIRLAFYHHDLIFHVYLDSLNFQREAWVELAKMFRALGETTIENRIADRDFGFYQDPSRFKVYFGRELEKEEFFWGVLSVINDVSANLSNTDFVGAILDYISSHNVAWQTKYQISLEGLNKLIHTQEELSHQESCEFLMPLKKYLNKFNF